MQIGVSQPQITMQRRRQPRVCNVPCSVPCAPHRKCQKSDHTMWVWHRRHVTQVPHQILGPGLDHLCKCQSSKAPPWAMKWSVGAVTTSRHDIWDCRAKTIGINMFRDRGKILTCLRDRYTWIFWLQILHQINKHSISIRLLLLLGRLPSHPMGRAMEVINYTSIELQHYRTI